MKFRVWKVFNLWKSQGILVSEILKEFRDVDHILTEIDNGLSTIKFRGLVIIVGAMEEKSVVPQGSLIFRAMELTFK